MISKILEIDGFGLFDNFRWDNNTFEFKKYNIFYGWNYSGKTTLSRVFSNFEVNRKHPDYPNCGSRILTADGGNFDCDTWGCPHPIKVFNTDFIETNLKWEAQIEPILLIGEENIKLQEQLRKLRGKLELKTKELRDASTKERSIQTALDSRITEKASHVKTTLSIVGYNRRNLIPVIQEIGSISQLLDEESLMKNIDIYRSAEKKDEISLMQVPINNLDSLKGTARRLLQTKIASRTIQKLLDEPGLGEWVKRGKEIHLGKDICEFCGNRLPTDLVDRLNEHFSNEYNDLIHSLTAAIENLESAAIRVSFVDEARMYQELSSEYCTLRDEAHALIQSYNENLERIIAALNEKMGNPFTSCDLPQIEENESIFLPIKKINDLISRHNEISKGFEIRKQQSLDILEKHFSSEFINDASYIEEMERISELKNVVATLESEIPDIESECRKIEVKLSETIKGAEKVNEYLKAFWGRRDITLKVSETDTFQLYRGTILAKNLSEGEKTAISFAYFITKLEEKGSDLSKTIVYIDDPISSLDSNHLFSTYSFIKNKLNDAHQLFISTHNYEFLNLLKDWLKKKESKKSSFYLIERCADNGSFCSCISNMPKELENFKSEYHYLFSILYDFHTNPVSDYNRLYLLPNLARRFLEAYLGFKIPIHEGLHKKLERFISDGIKEDKLLKFLDQYSHNNSLPRSLTFPDFGECNDCIDIIIDRMKAFDLDHFNYLVNEVI